MIVHGDAILTAYDITKVYETRTGPIEALATTSFDIQRGEFVSLVGSSGCGKTTILRMIAGLTPATSGELAFNGQRMERQPSKEVLRDVGFVFQAPNLLPWRSILSNAILPLQVMGLNTDEYRARALELLETVGLKGFEHVHPYELSGGMQMRASITRALVHDPKVLLMDEPFAALDAITREQLNFELLSIWEESQKTVLFVTHSISEAVLLSDRIFVMQAKPGRINTIIDVSLPRPRTPETLSNPEFLTLSETIRGMIQQNHAMGGRRDEQRAT